MQNKAAKTHKIRTVFWNLIAVGALSALCVSPALARDWDNNPPGPRGGPGTNWENPPGPVGGPGTSPNARPGKKAWYYNPPGPIAGPGAGPLWR